MEPHSDMAEDQLLSAEEPPQSSRPTRPLNALSKLVESDSESDNNEPQAQPSRGKLLARLQPQMNDETSESEEDDAVENGDAYERVKKMLMADTKKSDARKTPEPILQSTETISSEDEEDMPVRANNARRRPTRWEQDNSPRGSLVPSLISRESSPGLFVTPNASPAKRNVRGPAVGTTNSPSERHQDNQDLEERVRRIRAERLAKQKLQQKHKQPTKAARRDREASESDSDGENGRRLTQQSRPTRKAGKKALEDIAREQQRISRNMQLTHQAKTKKKYGVSDLFSRFGLAKVDSELVPAAAVALPDMSSAMASSDVEGAEQYDTPPSSPPKGDEEAHKGKTPDATTSTQQEERTTVDLAAAASNEPPRTLDKGKGRAPEFQHLPVNPLIEQTRPAQKVPAVNVSKPESADMVELSDSDDDLEIVQPGKPSIFDKIPERKQQQGGCSLLRLQYLANLNSPEKKGRKGQKGMSMAELRLSLAQKARQQAQRERDEKIEELRRRGIHIETVEERERHQLEIEDMVAQLEKSREEDFKLAKLEKAAAKKAGEILDDLPSSDESEDEDYTGSGDEAPVEEEEVGEEGELELSGSEEEMDEGDDADDEEMEEEQADNPLIDNVAEESEREQEAENVAQDHSKDVDDDEEEFQAPRPRPSTKRARKVIVEEDEESDQEPQRAPTQVTKNPSTPTRTTGFTSQSQDDDALAAFGGFDSAAKNLGLTQMFAGTMADYGSASQDAHPVDKEPEQDSLDYLRSLPDTQPSDLPTGLDPPDTLIPNSQTQMSPQKDMQFSLGISQLLESTPAFSPTQPAEEFEPTQDAGFQLPRSSAGLAPPTSTVETVMLSVAESPVMKKKSRLRRGKDAPQTVLPDMDGDFQADELASEAAEQTVDSGNAFSVMKKAAKKQKKVDNFNKKTSWARDAIHEQAEESEDEYAGIGGASDEDSDENDEELAEMIDTNEVKVDERRLAAYYAEKAKADDEKNINKLYKDLMNGNLRKRAGGDAFNLSDSEDEAEQRRRKRRMEHAQMTRALLADERVGKLAQNPKQAAFFRTLADHFEDPEYEFLDAPEMLMDAETSQSQSIEGTDSQDQTDVTVPDSQPIEAVAPINPLKRKSGDSQEKENRPPPHLRRTAAADNISRKPMTVADVQHSVAELLEDPRIMVPDSQLSDSESDLEVEPPQPKSKKAIIDRLGMSRAGSMADKDAGNHVAFYAPTAGAGLPGFRVPSLVRRATSNLSTVSTSTSGASTPIEGSGVRRGGTGRSNIHAQAREAERRAALEKVEKQRKETLKKKVGKARGKRSVLGHLDGGFE